MSLFFLVNVLPNLLFFMPAGILADRKSTKRIILFGYIGRGLVVTLLSVLYATKTIAPWMIYVGTFINSTFEAFSTPSQSAIIPKILDKKYIPTASGYYASIRSLVELLGVSIAGVLVNTVGISNVMLIDALTFFLAFGILRFIKIDDTGTASTLTIHSCMDDMKEAFRYIRKESVIFVIIICGAITNLAFTPLNVTQVIYVKEVLHMGADGMSLFSAATSLGAVLGGWYVGKKAAKFNLLHTFSGCLLAAAVTYFFLGSPAFVGVTTCLSVLIIVDLFLLSFFVAIMNTILSVYLMQTVPQVLLGRVFSLLSALFMITTPLGSLLSGMAEFIGTPMTIIASSLLIFLSALFLKIYLEKKKL